MYLEKNKGNYTFNFKNMSLKNSKKEVLLGLAIDNKICLDNHVKNIFAEKQDKRLANYQ